MPTRALALVLLTVLVSALAPATAGAEAFHVVLVGDSYASGEGTPDIQGSYVNDGLDRVRNENWESFTNDRAPERCHRSNRSGTALAVADLKAAFPGIEVTFGNFACSGAKVQSHPGNPDGGLLETQVGPDAKAQPNTKSPAQLVAANTYTNARSDPSERRIDALVMGIGGNDAFFSEIVRRCANIISAGDCNRGLREPVLGSLLSSDDALDVAVGLLPMSTDDVINLGFGYMGQAYRRLAGRLRPAPSPLPADDVARDVYLGVTPGKVLLLGYPNPTFVRRPANLAAPALTDYCNRLPAGDQIAEVTREEARYLDQRVLRPFASVMRDTATRNGWTFVDGHFDAFIDHGICRPFGVRWINVNRDGQVQQGSENELPRISNGIVHPNAAGHNLGYRPAVFTQLLVALVERYPGQAPQPTDVVADADPSGAPIPVDLTWGVRDNTTIASRFSYEVARWPQGRDGENDPIVFRKRVAAGVTRTKIWDPAEEKGRWTARVRSCVDQTQTCGAWSAPTPFSTVDPAGPLNVRMALSSNARLLTAWQHDPRWDQRDRFRYRLTFTRRTGNVREEIVRLPPTATSYVDNAQSGVGGTGVLVQACSWSTCTVPCPPSQACEQRASTPEPSPPSVTPGAVGSPSPPGTVFNPRLGAAGGTGAFALNRRKTQVGFGRFAPLEMAWAHPRQWRRMDTVELRVRDAERVLADVIVSETDGTVAVRAGDGSDLADGTQLGSKGPVTAGGVSVASGAARVLGTGKKGKGLRVRMPIAVAPGAVPAGTTLQLLAAGSDDDGSRQGFKPAGTLTVR